MTEKDNTHSKIGNMKIVQIDNSGATNITLPVPRQIGNTSDKTTFLKVGEVTKKKKIQKGKGGKTGT